MPNNLTDTEIKKALESYKKDIGCANCGFKDKYLLTEISNALDLINRQDEKINCLQTENEKWQGGYMTQKEEIANLEIELKAMRGAANSYKAENERLTHITRNLIGEIKAEAYTEFAERLRSIIMWSPKNHISITAKDVEMILKGMVENSNEV